MRPGEMMDTSRVKCCVFFLCIVLASCSKTTNDTSLENSDRSRKIAWSVYMDIAAETIGKTRDSFHNCRESAKNCQTWVEYYLEVVDDMINKALMNDPTSDDCTPQVPDSQQRISDCSDILRKGYKKSGVYRISAPMNRAIKNKTLTVYCDMETDGGGWTVLQRRGNFENSVDYFYKEWKYYKSGFGDIQKEFWIGNDIIHALTSQRDYSVRFDMEDGSGNSRYAVYDEFSIGDERNQYILYISNYSGDAGDAMKDSFGMKFTTSDKDNPGGCAKWFKGGWWYSGCFHAHLNGQKLKGVQKKPWYGIIWYEWKGWYEPLERSEIKIRPNNFKS